jgi:hypothetical protein
MKILKISTPYIISPLTHIINKTLSTGTFPSRLKYAEINPIFKDGEMTNIKNYRPIFLLTSFSKIFEKVMYKRLYNHFVNNNVFAPEQYGFRNKLSTELASYKLLNDVLTSLKNRSIVGGIFCDIRKAFDCVDHGILMSKMEFYGITGKTYQLIKSYLSDRYQRVIIDNNISTKYYSDWEVVCKDVPQGSILGPLLFLIYINDLPCILKDAGNPTLFADDTSIVYSYPSPIKF